jgi:hypothetical protein
MDATQTTPPPTSTTRRQPAAPCRNCGDATVGNYCPVCGQRKLEVRVSLRQMLLEVLDDQLALNSALPRTLFALLFRPGFLTREYVNGRIVRYIPPLRLYLVTSVVFFLLLSFKSNGIDLKRDISAAQQRTAAADSAATSARDTTALTTVADSARPRHITVQTGKPWTGVRLSTNLDSAAVEKGGWLRTDNVDLGVPALNEVVKSRLDALGELPPSEAMRRVGSGFVDHAPQAMFVLLPLFAGLLKLFYARRKRFYVEHFVFALHVHSFIFLVFTLLLLIPSALSGVDTALMLWVMLYPFLAMKSFYGQGIFKTAIKYSALGMSYSIALSLGMVATVVAVLLLG